MRYEGVVIRPPSEAGSLILQVTLGCSHNRCTFCSAYKQKKFRIRSLEDIREDIDGVRGKQYVRRVFLADGDALIVPRRMMMPVVDHLNESFPNLERIGMYANAKSVLKRTDDELRELADRGLGIVYLGLESGDEEVLTRVKKGVGTEEMIEAAHRIREAGILLSVTVLLGLAGPDGSERHARATGEVLTKMDPDYIGALTLMIVPGCPLYDDYMNGEFTVPDPMQSLKELAGIIEHTDVTDCLFTSNHASNYLPLKIELPDQKNEAVYLIRTVLDKDRRDMLRPERMRGL
ncbi:MAG: B12-binding domain-containing radical SAM protein [Deltaproteobacteria bacterium]|nr:B12-binding domain-containing radical SAM protein [Candidatus Zymogenaceae bacterium]